MGDLLMSAPAIRAMKETFNSSITLLTSPAAEGIAPYLPGVDEVLVWDVPWVKADSRKRRGGLPELAALLREKKFDAGIIFTVFSQNPLPTALLLTMAEIPNRLSYCRENPYALLTHWIPDEEPFRFIRHQVRRDLDLVGHFGATTDNDRILVNIPDSCEHQAMAKMARAGANPEEPWLILHPGVSEAKRRYEKQKWIEAGKIIQSGLGYQLVITGIESEKELAMEIARGIGNGACTIAGQLSLGEYIALVRRSPLLISVNTGSVHIASAVGTRTVVLYAMTNPQHAPWKTVGKVLPFSVPAHLQSQNEILRYVQENFFGSDTVTVTPEEIYEAARDLLKNGEEPLVPELVSAHSGTRSQRTRSTLYFHEP
ncbi:MAG TPA: glycosyltransferase family 9 protein [Chryseosolibacter sp.]